jgi:integrase
VPTFGAVRVTALTVEDVEGWLGVKAHTLAKSSVVKLRSYLAQAFDFGIRRRHATWNPARVAELPAETNGKREGRALTASEAKALLNVSEHHRYGAWVAVALTLGLRPGEVSSLTWEAIDFDAKTVTVYQSLGWSKTGPEFKSTKTWKTRTLELPAPTVEALRRHRASHAEERLLMGDRWPLKWRSLVFVTTNGLPLGATHLRKTVDSMATAARISGTVTPYDLRHSATSLLSAAGESAERLADLLGHKDTRMVFKHYRHPVTSTVSTAVDCWDRTG